MAALATDIAVKFGYHIDNTILKKPFCGVLIEQMQHNMLWNVLQCTVINMLLDMYAIDKRLDPFRFLYLQIGFAFLGLWTSRGKLYHYSDVIMGAMVCLTIVDSTVYSSANQRKHQCSESLAFEQIIHRWPVNSRTNGQLRGKFLHLKTSLCYTVIRLVAPLTTLVPNLRRCVTVVVAKWISMLRKLNDI